MSRLLIPAFAILILALLVACYWIGERTGRETTTGLDWLEIDNPNRLDVLFTGQAITVSSSNKDITEICFSSYDHWSEPLQFKFKENQCYDLDGKNAGICDNDSDIKITQDGIEFVNPESKILNLFSRSRNLKTSSFKDDGFLCSGQELSGVKEINVYPRALYALSNTFSISLCMDTGKGSFMIKFDGNDKILYKRENEPIEWECRNTPVTINAEDLEEGKDHLAFRKRDGMRYETYFLPKANQPYSILYNPSTYDSIHPYNETNKLFTVYDYFIIKTEFTDEITGLWYRCDDEPWKFHGINDRYKEIRIEHGSVCRGGGSHRLEYKTQYGGINSTPMEYRFFKGLKKPSIENVTFSLNYSDNRIYVFMKPGHNSIDVNGVLVSVFTNDVLYRTKNYIGIHDPSSSDFYTWETNTPFIELGCEPSRVTLTYQVFEFGLSGEEKNSTIFVSSTIPPQDIEISPENVYPDSELEVLVLPCGEKHGEDLDYMWFVNNLYRGTGNAFRSDGLEENDTITVQLSFQNENGSGNTIINKTVHVIVDDDYCFRRAMDDFDGTWCEHITDANMSSLCKSELGPYYFRRAMDDFDGTWCEHITDANMSSLCKSAVELGSKECRDRNVNEKFFCLAFFNGDPSYCSYIDLSWYKINCMVFTTGNQTGCDVLETHERDLCILEFASRRDNSSICEEIMDNDIKILCRAIATRDSGLCSMITDESLRERCELQSRYI